MLRSPFSKCWANVVLRLAHRQQGWPNIQLTLAHHYLRATFKLHHFLGELPPDLVQRLNTKLQRGKGHTGQTKHLSDWLI